MLNWPRRSLMNQNEKRLLAVKQKSPGRKDSSLQVVSAISPTDKIAVQINTLLEGAANNIKSALMQYLAAGELLLQKKNELAHGLFIEWHKTNINCSSASAHRYMKLAANKQLLEDLKNQEGRNGEDDPSLTKALNYIDSKLENPTQEIPINNKPIDHAVKEAKLFYKRFKSGERLTKKEKSTLKSFLTSEVERIESALKTKISILQGDIDNL